MHLHLSGKVSFHFLIFVFISHAIRHYKRHVLFPKGELFVFFNFFVFIASSVSFSMNEIDLIILRNKKLEKLVYDLLKKGVWRKIFPRLKNKAFCKRLKRWVEFLLFAQIYAVLNQNNWWAVNHWRQLHVLISSSQINQASS